MGQTTLFQKIPQTFMMKSTNKQNKFIVYREYMEEISVEELTSMS